MVSPGMTRSRKDEKTFGLYSHNPYNKVYYRVQITFYCVPTLTRGGTESTKYEVSFVTEKHCRTLIS